MIKIGGEYMQVAFDLLDSQKGYVVGVSGGPDSMALLDILYQAKYQIVVCLVNYHIRDDSDLDAVLVRRYCEDRKIPYFEHQQFEYQKGNFEAQARIIRYDFYHRICKRQQLAGVVLAHHKDDYLETVLMQKARGMQDVLLGIREVSMYRKMPVYRPLMQCFKEELVDYCQSHQIPYRIDYTNLENTYTRNYYRNEVLSRYAKEEKEALYLETLKANQGLRKKEKKADTWLAQNSVNNQLSWEVLAKENEQLYLLKRYLWQIEGMPKDKISNALVEGCLKTLKNAKSNVKISLPVNFVLIKEYDNIYVTKLKKSFSYYYTIEDAIPKDFGDFKIALDGDDREGIALTKEDFPLTIRTRKPGDVMELSYGKKKLSRLFIDAKVPPMDRDAWPVVLNCRNEIILVPKIAKNKHYLLAKPTLFVIQ